MKNMIFSNNKLLSGLFVGVFCCGMHMLTAMESYDGGTQPDAEGDCSAPASKKRCKEHRGDFASVHFKVGDLEGSYDIAGDGTGENVEAAFAMSLPGVDHSQHWNIHSVQYCDLLERVLMFMFSREGIPAHVARIKAKHECQELLSNWCKLSAFLHSEKGDFFNALQLMALQQASADGLSTAVINDRCPVKACKKCVDKDGIFAVDEFIIKMPCGHAFCGSCFEQILLINHFPAGLKCPLCRAECETKSTLAVHYQPADTEVSVAAPAAE